MSAGFELLVAFNGYSETYNRSIAEIDIDETRYKVIANNRVVKYENITPEQKSNITQIYSIVNRFIAPLLGLKQNRPPKVPNKYISTYNKTTDFCRNYLLVEDFNILNISKKYFLTVPNDKIKKVADNSNVLMFGNNQTDLVPYNGITNYGPYLPTKRNNVKFFFIAHKNCLNL